MLHTGGTVVLPIFCDELSVTFFYSFPSSLVSLLFKIERGVKICTVQFDSNLGQAYLGLSARKSDIFLWVEC